MRRCISEPTIRFPRPAPRSVATSAFTTPGALTRALTGRRQTMLTSLACRTSRQPEPGRRSTYQNRNAVQTNRATALERLAALMGEMFALTISEGAISNMLLRAREPLLAAAAAIRETVTASPVACSDETSARVSGKTWWEWVFVSTLAVLHIIRPSRGKAVVADLFGAIHPMVWVSDMLASHRGHGVEWQVCLAHLLRAIAIGRRRGTLKDTTLKHYQAD